MKKQSTLAKFLANKSGHTSIPKFQKEERRMQITELYLKGKTQGFIAELLGISQPMVSREIKKIIDLWQKSVWAGIDLLKREELARIEVMEKEAWEAWERSKTIPKRTRLKSYSARYGSDKPNSQRMETTEEESYGDPVFMQVIMGCWDRRCKILGLYAPTKISHVEDEESVQKAQSAREDILSRITAIAHKIQRPVTVEGAAESQKYLGEGEKSGDEIELPENNSSVINAEFKQRMEQEPQNIKTAPIITDIKGIAQEMTHGSKNMVQQVERMSEIPPGIQKALANKIRSRQLR